ncbi:DEAD/DEAH box helicase [Chitinophaga polysaccharea]|uniref:DEAD/DEAH box helicase n=1 Tax=Chitinophaga polysaccharea TaxID=1293035 RepID=UPI0011581B76|nr:DEAD/DEAH box helicase [Chitinophaga polysaccharea]
MKNHWELPHKPRKWQENALDEWCKSYKGIVSIVTGGGKTLFSFFCINEYRKKKKDGKIIIVVPTITLLDQWYVSLLDDFSVPSDQIACFSSEEKPKEWLTVNIIVINTARKKLKTLNEKEDFFLIVDECHRAGSPLNSEAIKGNYFATLGLSATPEREYDDGFKKYILPNLGKIIYTYDYIEALNDRVITPFTLNNVKVNLLPHEEEEYKKVSKKIRFLAEKDDENESGGFKIKMQRLLIKRAKISAGAMMRIPIACRIAEDHKAERIIIFHESIEGANTLNKILNERKNNSVVYHSGIGPIIRRDNLRLYRKGIFNILVTCKALDEGMNAPETSIAIIASSTASTRQRIQRLGRVLRPAINKTDAIIFTLYATEQEKNRLVTEYKKFKLNITINWLKGISK